MRIAVLSDIHANLPALSAILSDLSRRNCSRVYHAGDLIGIGPYPAEVVDVVRDAGMICVQGNHDQLLSTGIPLAPTPDIDDSEIRHEHWTHSRLDLDQKEFVRGFPYIVQDLLEGVDLTVLHFALTPSSAAFVQVNHRGTDEEILDAFAGTPGALICFGHIHPRKFNRQYLGRHFLNAGGVGTSHDSTASYAVVDVNNGSFNIELCKVTYERNALLKRYDVLEIPARDFIRKIFFGVE